MPRKRTPKTSKTRSLPRGISYIARDRVYRAQINGKYLGQASDLKEALCILAVGRRHVSKARGPHGHVLPPGMSWCRQAGVYRVRLYCTLIKRTITIGASADIEFAMALLKNGKETIKTYEALGDE